MKVRNPAAAAVDEHRPLIVFHDRMFGAPLGLERIECPAACLSEDPALLPAADAVVYHVPGERYRKNRPRTKPSGQLWIAWSLECEINYPEVNDPHFDLHMTYRRGADVWTPYFCDYGPGFLTALARPTPPRRADCVIASFVSSPVDNNGRSAYLADLSRHIGIHHFGTYLRNQDLEPDRGRETKLEIFRRYKFAVAFENTCAPDYVTEKYYDPLLTGAIPVYMGAPNIGDYAPGADCHIDAADFAGPAELARYLSTLNEDDAQRDRHLRWRREPLSRGFVDMVSTRQNLPHPFAQLAELVRERAIRMDRLTPGRARGWSLIETGDGLVLRQRPSGASININGATRRIWALINGRQTVAEICALLQDRYPSAARRIRRDVKETIRRLDYHGAVRLRE